MAEFHPEPRERREGVDDEATPVAGVMIALLGIRPLLERTVDADRVRHPFVFPPGMCLAHLCIGTCIAEGTPSKRLLHQSSSASLAARQPRWNTASWVIESKASPLGS